VSACALIRRPDPANVAGSAQIPTEDERKKGENMRPRNVKRIAALSFLLLICSVWALASRSAVLTVDDPPQYSDWSAPVNLGPVVNSVLSDQHQTISKDGLSLYFGSGRPGGFGDFDIYVSQRASVDEPWGLPQNLGSNVNSPYREFYPSLSPDGHSLYFSSTNPTTGFGGQDIYVSRRHNKRDDFGWQPAVNLGSAINTAASENFPFLFEDDETGSITLYFGSDRPGGMGGNDIYASTLQSDETFGTPVPVAELNSPFTDLAPAIRRDGLEMFLSSDRPGTLGSRDLWVSTRPSTADPWSTPVNLGPFVNSVADDNAPALSFKGTELYFFSLRPGSIGFSDLWVSTRTKIKEPD
jgi:hypothetical protein